MRKYIEPPEFFTLHLCRFDLLEKYGCSLELSSRLNYAFDKVETMLTSRAGTGRTMSARSNR